MELDIINIINEYSHNTINAYLMDNGCIAVVDVSGYKLTFKIVVDHCANSKLVCEYKHLLTGKKEEYTIFNTLHFNHLDQQKTMIYRFVEGCICICRTYDTSWRWGLFYPYGI